MATSVHSDSQPLADLNQPQSASEGALPPGRTEPSSSGVLLPLETSVALLSNQGSAGPAPGLEQLGSQAQSCRHDLATLGMHHLAASGPLGLDESSFLPQLHQASFHLPTELQGEKALVMAMAAPAQPGPNSFVGQLLGPDSVMIPAPETGAPQAPRDPTILTVHDRKVRDRDFYGRTPLYVLVRRWLQNDPNLEPLPIMPESQNAPVLPPPLPQPAEADTPPPSEAPFPYDKSSGNAEGLMDWHRSHWLKVRQHARVRGSKRKSRYKQRMELLNSHAQMPADIVPA